MAILDEILSWSQESLKPWQQDALRRLFQNSLNSEALDSLYQMLKASHGIPVDEAVEPIPLSKDHIPTTQKKESVATLKAIKEVCNVNKLMPGQTLEFGSAGITLIYGENGAGKSGYTRILKRACRSRDGNEVVMPDVGQDPLTVGIPSAVFEVEIAGKSIELNWASNKPSPQELAGVAVFDTHSARAHLDEDQEVVYVPFGLDIVENLARIVMPEIETRVDLEAAQISTSSEHLAHLLGGTKVGSLIKQLDASTELSKILELATLTEAEIAHEEELNKILKEPDPAQKAKSIGLQAKRITAISDKFSDALIKLNDDAVKNHLKSYGELQAAIKAESLASHELSSEEALLPGTGGYVWKALYESAKKYSMEEAYPNINFPHLHSESQCVLCQQKLDQSSVSRFERFKKYIEDDVAKIVLSKRAIHQGRLDAIERLVLPVVINEEDLLELNEFNSAIGKQIIDLNSSLGARKEWLLKINDSTKFDDAPKLNITVIDSIESIVTSLELEAKKLLEATNQSDKDKLTVQFNELQARKNLSKCQQSVIELVGRLKAKASLIKCKDDLKTRYISEKAKALATSAVTAPLRASLEREFKLLGVSALKTKVEERVEKGRMKHRLELDAKSDAVLRNVLSEGEQRAIAIAAFLAELNALGHSGAIIFDDPVSSLDHFRRAQVTRRLVLESKSRQVIIFTHDTVFLSLLASEIEDSGIDFFVQNLSWSGSNSGKVQGGLPWDHMKLTTRLDKLKQFHAELRRIWVPYPDEILIQHMRERYSNLRATIERLIEDKVFNGVVERYRDWIKVGNLSKVVGFADSEFDGIARLYKTCCDITRAHDAPSAKNASIPTPDEFGDDIKEFERLMNLVKARMDKIKG